MSIDGCIRKLQHSSQILKHLCDFLLPQSWFGYYSRLSAPKYAWLNIWEGKEQASVSTVCDEYCRNRDMPIVAIAIS